MDKFYSPLVKFKLKRQMYKEYEDMLITKDIKIVLNKELPILEPLRTVLAQRKIDQYEQVSYWLTINNDVNGVKEIINIFQLALWIIRPTELQIHFFHNLSKKIEHQKGYHFFSRFTHIPKNIYDKYEYQDFEKLRIYFPAMQKLYEENRFHNSISFNYHGCITNSWEAAYIQFSTTFESLLTHNNKWGVKKKLAWAYAILTETQDIKRQKAFNKFREIYQIRSEILHGKSFKDKYGKGEINLERLANCRDMLRKLWQVILDTPEMIEKLSLSDGKRRKYFKKVANGWMPEGIINKKRCNILYITFNLLKKLIGCNYSLFL